MVTYLTGGSGYLGGEIVRALALNESTAHAEVLVPVRDKGGKTGQERFDALFTGGRNPHEHTRWVAPEEPIPDDAEVVILNAFDVAFHKDIARVLRESVAPTLALLEECSRQSLKNGKLRKVIIVSTAYVQPPLPFKRCDGPITPFHGAADPWALYNKLLKGEIGWQDLVDDKDNDSHFTTNAYIYAKTLLEHLVATFNGLPCTYIVRPSIIGPSRCGTRGNAASPGCASAKLMDSPVGRFVPSTGCECLHGFLHCLIYGLHPSATRLPTPVHSRLISICSRLIKRPRPVLSTHRFRQCLRGRRCAQNRPGCHRRATGRPCCQPARSLGD